MKYLQNLHTHTVYCDGKDTPEDLVHKALSLGFDTLGFSIHSYMFFSDYIADSSSEYKVEIASLKEKYKDKINILCGMELDLYSKVDLTGYDYIIGSMHYFKIGDEYVAFDRNSAHVQKVINEYFDGDGMKYARRYYEEFSNLHSVTGAKIDIIGHFDIITKHKETAGFFDTSSKEYKTYAIDTLRVLANKTDIFEMNTGAISRNYRTTPYPEPFLIKEINRLGKGIILSSDCHDKDYLDCNFNESIEILKECGVGEVYILTPDGFKPQPLY